MKKMIFSILITIILFGCGSKNSTNNSDPSYVSITKEAGGPIACQGCFVMDYKDDLFYVSYQAIDVETCQGAGVYRAETVISLPSQNGQKINYNVIKVSGPNDANCFPDNTTFEITSESNNSEPGKIELYTGLDIYNMCLTTGCN